MPPKPFNPPRPSGTFSASSSTKSKSKPKPKPTKSIFSSPSTSMSKVTKSKPKSKSQSTGFNPKDRPGEAEKRKGKGKARESDGQDREARGRKKGSDFVLPSLSPDSDMEVAEAASSLQSGSQMEEGSAQEEEEEGDSEEDSSSLLDLSRAKSKRRKSGHLDVEPRGAVDDAEDEDEEGAAAGEHIPAALLSVLLQVHFTNKGARDGSGNGRTRIKMDATRAVGKYVDTFVREAMARAAFGDGGDESGAVDGGVLEVEMLERLCPQLLLDF